MHARYQNGVCVEADIRIGAFDGDVVVGRGVSDLPEPDRGHEVARDEKTTTRFYGASAYRVALADGDEGSGFEGTGVGLQHSERVRLLIV